MPTTPTVPAPKDQQAISHALSFEEASGNYLLVQSRFPAGQESLTLMMAVWTPGSYLVREYPQHLERLNITTEVGKPLEFEQVAKNRWRVATDGAPTVVVRYALYAHEMSVRTNWVDDDFAMLNGAPTFMVPVDGTSLPHEIQVNTPEKWPDITTALPAVEGRDKTYLARDFDTVVDSPFLIGDLALHTFDVGGVEHVLANYGEEPLWDGKQAARDVQKIVETERDFWGQLPYDRYIFQNVIGDTYGGLEHKDSTLMMIPRWNFRDREKYLGWLGLVSHEFFHTWNVKRLRPIELGPFDYENENHTVGMWVAEGITSYYDDLFVRRAGLADVDEYLKMLSKQIERLQQTPGRKIQSLHESSYNAWTKFYRQGENAKNSQVSYYTKGAVVAFLLDAKIRKVTAGRKSLDDVMRAAYEKFSGEQGFTDVAFRTLVDDIAGVSLSDWLTAALEGTSELDYSEALDWYGLQFKVPDTDTSPEASLGADFKRSSGKLLFKFVDRGGPCFEADISAGDELVAIDGLRITRDVGERLKQYKPGDKVTLLIARRGAMQTVELKLDSAPTDTWSLETDDKAGSTQRAQRSSWLGG